MDDLKNFIISRIRREGPIPFARFMDWCLYHEKFGYYRSGTARIGREGDYFTAPCVSHLFGDMVARQLCQMSELLGCGRFTVLEAGAGRGFLCSDILTWIKENDQSVYNRLEYYIVEVSPSFCRELELRLPEEFEKGKIRWLDPAILSDGTCHVTGCILTNELVDSFPVHRLVCKDGELKEIYVSEKENRFEEKRGDLSDDRLGKYFSNLGITLAEEQTVEVNLRALEWLEKMADCITRGFLMTIDYGAMARELYDPWRRKGTLRCYAGHHVADSPYENIGEQDITSHVDFTSLIRKGEERGLSLTGFVPQYRFLIALGLLEEIEKRTAGMSDVESLQVRLSLKTLIEPERGMGEVFKVLIQHKGLDSPALQGLKTLGTVAMERKEGIHV